MRLPWNVSDGSQSLYERTQFTWKSIGIKARGRSKKLNQNYRNTQEILSAAWSMIDSKSTASFSDSKKQKDETFPIIEPSLALRNGKKPVFVLTKNALTTVEVLFGQIEKLLSRGHQPENIAVIYNYCKGGFYKKYFQLLIDRLGQNQIEHYWITESRKTKRNYSSLLPGVKIITASSSLGLDFKIVMIPWIQQFDRYYSSDRNSILRNKRKLYVAMTRAQEKLYLFGSGNSSFIEDFRQSSYFCQVKIR